LVTLEVALITLVVVATVAHLPSDLIALHLVDMVQTVDSSTLVVLEEMDQVVT
tara:strand:+ start:59 stop:217 length:159 start_codon:yes stop_codon:yes gene_type:complete